MLIHSHRGLGYGRPENTLPAFRAALQAGHGIELDVRLSQSGQIFIKHDSLTNEDRCPTFDDFGRLIHEFWPLRADTLAIHLKLQEQTAPMMSALAAKMNEFNLWNAAFVFDVTRRAIDYLRGLDPRFKLAISVGAARHTTTIYIVDDLEEFPDIDIYWMDEWSVPYSVNNEANYRKFKRQGKKLYVISPDVAVQNNHPWARAGLYRQMWQNLAGWQADGICTDLPQELAAWQRRVAARTRRLA